MKPNSAVACLFLAALTACAPARKAPPSIGIAAAMKQAGIESKGVVALYEEKDERAAADGHGFWLAQLAQSMELPGKSVEISSPTVLAVFERLLGNGVVGKPLDEKSPTMEWKAAGFQWRAMTLRTDKGIYLSLERLR